MIGENHRCPGCNKAGEKVPVKTIQALVKDDIKAKLKSLEGFRFCASAECEIVYYNSITLEVILKDQIKEPVFQKSDDPDRKVCYCFGYTVRQIQEDAIKHGKSILLEELKSKCKQGKPRCSETNPQGKCCLSNFVKVVEETLGRKMNKDSAICCCSSSCNEKVSQSQSDYGCCCN